MCAKLSKGRIYSTGRKILERQDPIELFFAKVPLNVERIELIAPDFLDPLLGQTKFMALLQPRYNL